MCDCTSCKATDTASKLIGKKLVPLPFSEWPKGELSPSNVYGHDKIHKDKAYTAHWNHCGAEAHRQRTTLDMKCTVHSGRPTSPATMKFPYTRLNESGWRERMLNPNTSPAPKVQAKVAAPVVLVPPPTLPLTGKGSVKCAVRVLRAQITHARKLAGTESKIDILNQRLRALYTNEQRAFS